MQNTSVGRPRTTTTASSSTSRRISLSAHPTPPVNSGEPHPVERCGVAGVLARLAQRERHRVQVLAFPHRLLLQHVRLGGLKNAVEPAPHGEGQICFGMVTLRVVTAEQVGHAPDDGREVPPGLFVDSSPASSASSPFPLSARLTEPPWASASPQLARCDQRSFSASWAVSSAVPQGASPASSPRCQRRSQPLSRSARRARDAWSAPLPAAKPVRPLGLVCTAASAGRCSITCASSSRVGAHARSLSYSQSRSTQRPRPAADRRHTGPSDGGICGCWSAQGAARAASRLSRSP
jgi:hypothetical protein